MKKKKIFSLIMLLFPLLIVAGISAWILASNHNIKPTYNPDHELATYFANNTYTTYNSSEQIPEVNDGYFEDEKIKESFVDSLTYSYAIYDKDDNLSEYLFGKPTNAGKYNIRISYSSDDEDLTEDSALFVDFTINKATPYVTSDVNVNYPEGKTYFTSNDLSINLISSLSYTGELSFKNENNQDEVIEGTIVYSDSKSKLSVGTYTYQYTFYPADLDNFNTYSATTEITRFAIINYKEIFPYANDSLTPIEGSSEVAVDTSLTDLNLPSVNNSFVGYDDPDDTSLFGWSTTSDKFTSASNFKVTEDTTLYYIHVPIIYTITYVFDSDESFKPGETIKYQYTVEDYDFTLPTPIKSNTDYDFVYWIDENGNAETKVSVGERSDRTFTAIFKIPLTVTVTNNTYTYDGKNHSLSAAVSYTENGVKYNTTPSGVTFTYANNSHSDAGSYSVTVDMNNHEKYYMPSSITGILKINQRTIYLSSQTIEVDYSTSTRTFATIQTAVQPKVQFEYEDEDGNVVTLTFTSGVTLNGMHDGYFYYGNASGSEKTTNVVGSTYKGTISFTNKNYVLSSSSSNEVLIKYKTVKVGSTYFTIEDAIKIAGSNMILLEGEASNTNYVLTSFTSLDRSITGYTDSNYVLKTKLRIPFADVNMDFHGSGGQTSIGGSTKGCDGIAVTSVDAVYAALKIPSHITLTLNSGSTLAVGGLVSGSGAVTNRGVLLNNGTINANADTNILAYGFIKGTGMINLYDQAYAIDVLRMYDWLGGAGAGGLNSAKIFPLNAFSFHNISCNMKVYTGSTYEAFWTVAFNNTLYKGYQRGDLNGNLVLFGEGGMFEISSGYILRSSSNSIKNSTSTALSSITGSNQVKGQKEIFKIYGPCIDNEVSISISASLFTFDMKSSVDLALPISYFDISIGNDGEGNIGSLSISKSSFKFLPGSSLTIEDKATLNVTNGASLTFYDVNSCIADEAGKGTGQFITSSGGHCVDRNDAYLKNDGILTIDSGCGLSGKITTTDSTGNINLNGKSTTSVIYATSKSDGLITDNYSTSTRTYNTKLFMYDETNNTLANITSNASDNTVYFAKNGGWVVSPKYTIQFNGNGGTVVNDELHYRIDAESTITLEEMEIADPYRPYYNFTGWYIDENCTQTYVGTSVSTGQTITLYAGWEKITYNVEYNITYENGETYTYTEKTSFDVDSEYVALPKPNIDGYNFYGWYRVSSFNEDYYVGTNNIAFESFERYYSAGSNNIVLYGFISEDPYYLIEYQTYDSNYDSGISITSQRINSKDAASYVIPDYANSGIIVYDGDVNVEYYFGGWYLDENYTIPFDASKITGNTIVYAKWIEKQSITYNYQIDGLANTTYYYIKGSDVSINAITPSKTGYSFGSWNTAANGSGTKYESITTSTFSSNTTLYAQYEPNTYKVTIKGVSGEREAVISFTDANGSSQSISIGASNTTVYEFDVKYGTSISISSRYYGISGKGTNVSISGGGISESHSNGRFSSLSETITVPAGDITITVSSA